MEYSNQPCDGCGLPLAPQDDVVVCPVCGAPQHRHCYEARGNRCVNEEKHAEGFVWHAQETAGAKGAFVCPVCGHSNEAGAPECARCGQPFSAEALKREPPRPTQDPSALAQRLFFDAPTGEADMPLDDEDRRQVEFVLTQRMLQATPGMTDEQAQETLCGHPLRQVMAFISTKAMTYLQKFRAIESGRKLGWNWAAFLFSPYWFFYRKLYKPGIVFFTLRICITLAVYNPVLRVSELMASLSAAAQEQTLTQEVLNDLLAQVSAHAPILYLCVGILLLLAVASGLLADRLYHRYVGTTLTAAKKLESRDAFLVAFLKKSSVSPLAAVLSYAAFSILPNPIMSFFV